MFIRSGAKGASSKTRNEAWCLRQLEWLLHPSSMDLITSPALSCRCPDALECLLGCGLLPDIGRRLLCYDSWILAPLFRSRWVETCQIGICDPETEWCNSSENSGYCHLILRVWWLEYPISGKLQCLQNPVKERELAVKVSNVWKHLAADTTMCSLEIANFQLMLRQCFPVVHVKVWLFPASQWTSTWKGL